MTALSERQSWAQVMYGVRMQYTRPLRFARPERPSFGYAPGEVYEARRWPDVMRSLYRSTTAGSWHINAVFANSTLVELRDGFTSLTTGEVIGILYGLGLTREGADVVRPFLLTTDFTDPEAEWALANIIDAAVEVHSQP